MNEHDILEGVIVKTEEQKLAEIDDVVEDIVVKWNSLVSYIQNSTISLCLLINEILKEYPDETIKDILVKVRDHPNIKKFVSIDRIWQGMRLIKKRPDLIEYHMLPEEKKNELDDFDKPYLKKDGEVFWEFYFELAKQPLSDGMITALEQDGKQNQWSFRQLRDKIQEVKIEQGTPCGFENTKKEKFSLMRDIHSAIKDFNIDQLRRIKILCDAINRGELK